MIGARIARLRAQHGDSLRAAAARTGVSHTTIARIEKGEVTGSYYRTLQKIAQGYGVKVEYLLTGRDPREDFQAFLRRLPSEERYRLCFAGLPTRVKLVMDFLMAEYADEFNLPHLARLLGMDQGRLSELAQGGYPAGQPDWTQAAAGLSRLTGISLHWFRWGDMEEFGLESIPPDAVNSYVKVVRKAARAGIQPAMLEMAVDLLVRSRSALPA